MNFYDVYKANGKLAGNSCRPMKKAVSYIPH